ncbi:hypothetical protein KAH27_01750 [bacterium]|nr:hypothetical protein [bacterium]
MTLRPYYFLTSFILLSTVMVHADAVSEVALIRNNLMPWAISYRKVGDEPRKTVAEYLALLNSDGSFSDKSSTIDVMTGRLVYMAQAFKDDSTWEGNIELKAGLYSAVQYWLNHDPGNSGWTAGCFNEPSSMDSIGLCLYDAIQSDKAASPEMIPQLTTLMNGMVDWANAAWTVGSGNELFVGANISYRLMGMIGRAAMANSPEMFDDITNITATTFSVEGNYLDNGMSIDQTWNQHNYSGRQNYWIGYGSDWMNITRNSFTYMKNTQWNLTFDQLNIFADCILDGWQWQIYRYQGVYSLGGRHNLTKSALRGNYIVGQINLLRSYAGSGNLIRDNELQQAKTRIKNSGNSDSYPSFDASKYFYNSDLMIYGKPFHYVAVKMLSDRTAGPESGSGLGKLNYHFGEGSTMIFKTDDEYRNARVGWNFRAIPGTTVEQKVGDLPNVDFGQRNGSINTFAGGLSDSNYSLCSFQLNHSSYNNHYNTVTANKGYFFFDNEFVALGSEIKQNDSGDGKEIWTTIDQPERKSTVTYFIDDNLNTIPLSTSTQHDFNNITNGAWFHCNNKGYIIFPDTNGVNIKLWAENRLGDWHDLDDRYSSGNNQTVNIFQLSINHLTEPTDSKYAYLVLPDITKEEMSSYWSNIPVKILENSESIQAVQYSNSNITEIVFYQADSIAIESPFFKGGMGDLDLDSNLTVSVDKPAIVIFRELDNEFGISIADPNQDLSQIVMTINAKLADGTNIVWNPSTGNSEITFTLPQGIYAGKSVNEIFVIIPEPCFLLFIIEILTFFTLAKNKKY